MNFRKKQKGFSFGETLLATFVLSIGLLSVVKLFQISIEKSIILRDATIATGLAQEGIELIRSGRDSEMLKVGSTVGFPATITQEGTWCISSYQNNTTVSCGHSNALTNSRIYLNGGYYDNSPSANQTRFYRAIYIPNVQRDGSGNVQQVTYRSFSFWDSTSAPPSNGNPANCSIRNKCVYLEATLTDWKH